MGNGIQAEKSIRRDRCDFLGNIFLHFLGKWHEKYYFS